MNLFWLPMPAFCVRGFMCTCFLSLPALCHGGYLFFQLCGEGCLSASPLSARQSRPLHPPCLFAAVHSATWACPLCCKVCVGWVGLYAAATLGFLNLSPRSVCGHSTGAVNGSRSVAFSVSCPPRPCFVRFSDSEAPFWPVCESVSQRAQEPLLF